MAQTPHQIRTACHQAMQQLNWIVQDYFSRGHNAHLWTTHILSQAVRVLEQVALNIDTTYPRGQAYQQQLMNIIACARRISVASHRESITRDHPTFRNEYLEHEMALDQGMRILRDLLAAWNAPAPQLHWPQDLAARAVDH